MQYNVRVLEAYYLYTTPTCQAHKETLARADASIPHLRHTFKYRSLLTYTIANMPRSAAARKALSLLAQAAPAVEGVAAEAFNAAKTRALSTIAGK